MHFKEYFRTEISLIISNSGSSFVPGRHTGISSVQINPSYRFIIVVVDKLSRTFLIGRLMSQNKIMNSSVYILSNQPPPITHQLANSIYKKLLHNSSHESQGEHEALQKLGTKQNWNMEQKQPGKNKVKQN